MPISTEVVNDNPSNGGRAISHVSARDSIYTLKPRRRGIGLSDSPHAAQMGTITDHLIDALNALEWAARPTYQSG